MNWSCLNGLLLIETLRRDAPLICVITLQQSVLRARKDQ
jgi:hypothetical protein